MDSIKKSRTVNSGSFSEWKRVFQPEETGKILAESKPVRLRWVLEVYFLLLVLFSVIRIYYSTQLRSMMHAFFNNTVLQQLNKEENVYNKWPFVFLFVLFSFVSGMFFYLGFAAQFNISFSNPLQFFLLISGLVFLYVLFKVWITKALGFIFEVKSVSKEYVSVVYLCYFNGALLLLPINFIFLFSSAQVSAISFIISCVLLTSLFLFQVLRLSLSILKVHKFSKFYLILYFCTLEIGPILLLYKLLDYNLL